MTERQQSADMTVHYIHQLIETMGGVGSGDMYEGGAATTEDEVFRPVITPRYTFVGEHQDPYLVQGAEDYLNSVAPQVEAKELTDHPYTDAIGGIYDCLLAFGTSLGVDLSNNIRPVNYVHFYTPEEYKKYDGSSEDRQVLLRFSSTRGIYSQHLTPEGVRQR